MASAQVVLPKAVIDAMWSALPAVAERTVAMVIAEVPSYADAFSGRMGRVIENAVQQALQGFIKEATEPPGDDTAAGPVSPSLVGAYSLGRGEARQGRSTDVLLAAYRTGATVAWRELSGIAVSHGLPGDTLALFAELMFSYIDRLSAYSVAGHAEELAISGLSRQRNRERLVQQILAGSSVDDLASAAERAEWRPPRTLTALALSEGAERVIAAQLDPRTLRLPDNIADRTGEQWLVLLLPDVNPRTRTKLVGALADHRAVLGPARPWTNASASVNRVMRSIEMDLGSGAAMDTDDYLTELVLRADPIALSDLRSKILAPLDDLRPATREKLVETLRAWLLHHGRRDQIAASLHVHPQTVRYRVGQLRERYGERLDDPCTVLELTIALGSTGVAGSNGSPTAGGC
ncbi:helix-turn-helix domain-containing protein [Nocardia sp. NPDC005366]|uniref:PucR family transcriptional regulator n=1 Tax=Nocardia sp. NPDC005366 TaxID=3156878 RepID=UPI0033B71142